MDLSQLHVGSPISYVVAFVTPALDAILPILPSETAIVALGVATAGSTDPRIIALLFLAAMGAFLGDNLSYTIGRQFQPLVDRRFFANSKGQRRRAWAERSLNKFGARLIVVCRFIPGGRTAVTLTCGVIAYSRRVFVVSTAFAGALWASYAFFIGRLGGRAFEGRPWAGFVIALGAAMCVSTLIEFARRAPRMWRRIRHLRSR